MCYPWYKYFVYVVSVTSLQFLMYKLRATYGEASKTNRVSRVRGPCWIVLTVERPPSSAAAESNSKVNSTKEPWFQGRMNRAVADDQLFKSQRLDGTFLVRESDAISVRQDPVYMLSILYNGSCYHLEIARRQDGKYALGGIRGEKAFKTSEKLVDHYGKKNVDLEGSGHTKWKYYLD